MSAPMDDHTHELAAAQLQASAAAAERLEAAYAALERRLERITAALAVVEAGPVPAAVVAPGQLRLVVGG